MTRMSVRRGRALAGAGAACIGVLLTAAAAFGRPAARPTGVAPPIGPVTVVDRPMITSDTVSFDFANLSIRTVADYLTRQTGHNVMVDKDVEFTVTLKLVDVDWRRALEEMLRGTGCYLEEEGPNIFRISKPETITAWGNEADVRKVINDIAKVANAPIVIAPDVKGAIDYSFKDVPWKEALTTIVKSAGFVTVREGTVIRVVSPAVLREQMETRIFPLKYVQPPATFTATIDTRYAVGKPAPGALDTATGVDKGFTLFYALSKCLSERGRLQYVVDSNSFIATDTKPVLDQIQQMIERVDIEPLQVFFDVRFVTTTGDDLLDFGVDWEHGATAALTPGAMLTRFPFTKGREGGFIEDTFGLTGRGFSSADMTAFLGGASPFLFGTLDFSAATAVLKLLKNDSRTKVRQAPRLMVLNHQAGTVFVGSTIRWAEIFSSSNQAGSVVAGIREAANSPINTGFQLFVVPHVVRGTSDILLTVIPESNALKEFLNFGAGENRIQLPQVNSSTVVTQMLVRDGDTAIIGGLVTDREEEQVRKIPFLGDVPFAGYLFKWKTRSRTQDHLMIFITCHIVRNAGETRKILSNHRPYDWAPPAPKEDEENAEPTSGPTTRPAG
jgi:type IV pilus assembly protein PilQ